MSQVTKNNSLSASITLRVRFNEVDSLGIAWHGHYVSYFEEGREAFGAQHGLHYLEIFNNGYIAPIVNLNCDYKRMLKYGDSIIIETTFENCSAAKIVFKYKIFNSITKELVVTGTTTQVFLDVKLQQLQLQSPDFFVNWKVKNGLL